MTRTTTRSNPRSRRRSPKKRETGSAERLQKILASAGVASRRASEKLIVEGRVSVNGRVVRELGTRANAARDRIEVDGKRLRGARNPRHYLVYKPRGVVSTTRDPQERRTVLDLVPSKERLFPVGRLDAASEGLLLVTNDGAIAQALLHPSYQVPRTYKVSVDGRVRAPTLRKLASGIELDGRKTAKCEVGLLESSDERSVIEMTLVEGRRRQIREMLESVGHPVRRLLRVRFGPLRLTRLRPGEWRPLTDRESDALARMVRDAAGGKSAGKPAKRNSE